MKKKRSRLRFCIEVGFNGCFSGDVMMRYPSSLVSLHLSDNKLTRWSKGQSNEILRTFLPVYIGQDEKQNISKRIFLSELTSFADFLLASLVKERNVFQMSFVTHFSISLFDQLQKPQFSAKICF